jgi:hypothetical protein
MEKSGKTSLKKIGTYVNVLKDSGSLGKPARADLTYIADSTRQENLKRS